MTDGKISQTEALEKGLVPLRAYMIKHTRENDLALFYVCRKRRARIRLTMCRRPR